MTFAHAGTDLARELLVQVLGNALKFSQGQVITVSALCTRRCGRAGHLCVPGTTAWV